MSIVLSVKDLRTEFRMRTANVVAVDGVSFDIAAGECVGLVGESGCGKTTILNMIAGFIGVAVAHVAAADRENRVAHHVQKGGSARE